MHISIDLFHINKAIDDVSYSSVINGIVRSVMATGTVVLGLHLPRWLIGHYRGRLDGESARFSGTCGGVGSVA